mmetsp:Transcript_3520/g.8008  ORF Transcript_3520/g.8008 Transcript_3520/m.8008 type:complete len:159 (+) Transcript_3520:393-869(+)
MQYPAPHITRRHYTTHQHTTTLHVSLSYTRSPNNPSLEHMATRHAPTRYHSYTPRPPTVDTHLIKAIILMHIYMLLSVGRLLSWCNSGTSSSRGSSRLSVVGIVMLFIDGWGGDGGRWGGDGVRVGQKQTHRQLKCHRPHKLGVLQLPHTPNRPPLVH